MEMPEIKTPEISRRVGLTDRTKKIYIEDYVVQFLKMFKDEESGDAEIFLFGSRYICGGVEIYIIYGACENISIKMEAYGSKTDGILNGFTEQEKIGCLNMEIWRSTEDEYSGIIVGNAGGGQPVEGYYIYYDADERMGEYIGSCWKKSLGSSKKVLAEKAESCDINKESEGAELVALSCDKRENPISPYAGIRIAVVCIFIILCTIAVTTINSYDRLQYFIKAAVQTNEIIEER